MSSTLKLGSHLGGYTLIRLIARGGMGEVYEALEIKLQRHVALKVIAADPNAGHDHDELVQRFLQEARTLAKVNHPNIVTIYAIDNVQGQPILAMELIDGVSLRELLEHITFSVDGAIPIFEQILEGLKCLHDNRIIHRDLKPHNILLRRDGQIKILDFGIAKHMGSSGLTRAGAVLGTIPYMPPEVISGGSASIRSDLWSLGAIFYEALVGQRLKNAMEAAGTAKEIPYSPDALARIPYEMRQILAKMCTHNPKDRYASAAEIITDLKALQAIRPPIPESAREALLKKVEELIVSQRTQSSVESPKVRVRAVPPPDDPSTKTIAAPIERRQKPRPSKSHKSSSKWIAQTAIGIVAAVLLWLAVEPPRSSSPSPTLSPTETHDGDGDAADSTAAIAKPNVPLAPELTSPEDKQPLWIDPTRLPTFAWTQLLKAGDYDIQIANDTHFKKVAIQEGVIGNSYRPGRLMPEGTYYWRLKARHDHEKSTPTHTFTLVLKAAPELSKPDTDHVIESQGSAVPVDFSWSCKPLPMHYRFQVARDEQFVDLQENMVLSTCHAENIKIPPGDYLWRVHLEDAPGGENLWSEIRGLTVRLVHKSQPLTLNEPKIRRRHISMTLNFKEPPRDVASLREVSTSFPSLSWSAVPHASSYFVQISSSKNFTRLSSEEHPGRTHFEWKDVVPGRTYWRVAAVAADGTHGNFSEAGVIDILLPAPHLDNFYKFSIPNDVKSTPSLRWEPSAFAEKYVVQMGPTRDLASASQRSTDQPQLDLGPNSGRYFVRVAAADANGKPISGFSRVAAVEVERPFVLAAPKAQTPATGAHASARGDKISVIFSWTGVDTAESYQLQVASDSGFGKLLDERYTKEHGAVLKQAPLKGRVYWRVRAKSAAGTSPWSDPSYFDVN